MGETATVEALRELARRLLREVESHARDYHHRTPPELLAEARRLLGPEEPARAAPGPGAEEEAP